jgi:hypothetical protein
MVVVQLKGVPTEFECLETKFEFLDYLYTRLIDIAEELDTNTINFIGDRPILH